MINKNRILRGLNSPSKIYKLSLALSSSFYLLGVIIGLFDTEDYLVTNYQEIDITQPRFSFFLQILINNTALVSMIIIGSISFGILSCLLLIVNGYVLGRLINYINTDLGYIYYKNLVPHISEIFGLVLAGSVSFYLIFRFINNKSISLSYFIKDKYLIKYSILSYLLILISAFLEVYISFNL